MIKEFKVRGLHQGAPQQDVGFFGLPDTCPHCHKKITPNPISCYLKSRSSWEVFMACPDSANCGYSFIGYYKSENNTNTYTGRTSYGTIETRAFSDHIQTISLSFIKIYNQAYAAEQQDLLEICGVGYRKGLEFLIKDYAVQNYPDKKEAIEKQMLASCIGTYVNDNRIKSVSKRAVWLGNDETHYVRKWEGKNLEDLKKLIDLTLHWIEMEVLTKSFEDEMPDS